MGLWLALGVMTLAAVGLALAPLVRRGGRAPDRRAYELRVYRAQLAELERDQGRGVLGAGEAAAARLEVERRMLAADAAAGSGAAALVPLRRSWPLALALALALPALASGLYWLLGSPRQPAAPHAERAAERQEMAAAQAREQGLPSVETMIARAEERVQASPDDLEGWLRLGHAYTLAGGFAQAADAYREVIRRDDGLAEVHAALGEALVMSNGGTVSPQARVAFERALALDASDPRARYYAGLGDLQRGERQAALDAWAALIADTRENAPWLPDLRARAAALAEDLGLDPAQALPASRPAPPVDEAALRADAAALEAALAADPKDHQGWIRLARTWAQLGERARAQAALTRGAEAFPGAPFVQQQLQLAAAELGLEVGAEAGPAGPTAEQMAAARDLSPTERDQMIRGMVDGLAARLAEQPDDVEGWRMLGRSWTVLGEPEKAADAFAEVARRLPENIAAQADYASALVAAQPPDAAPSAAAIAQLRKVLELDPENGEALFHLGRAAMAAGNSAGAAAYWRRLLGRLPAGSPERAAIEDLLERLEPGADRRPLSPRAAPQGDRRGAPRRRSGALQARSSPSP